MDLRCLINIILIICAAGFIFVLPSTIYTAMFLGIFYRRKPLLLDSDDLKGTFYDNYRDDLRKAITEAKQIDCELITIKSYDNLKLVARYYNQNSDTTVLLSHGYQSNSFNNFSTLLKYFLSTGYNVLIIDQRAHGSSEGRFTTTACKEQTDLMSWIDWIDKNSCCSNIYLYGISMGATTIGLASNKIENPKVKGLIMEAGFTSFFDELSYSTKEFFMKKAALNYIVLCTKHILKIDIKKSAVDSLLQTKIPVLFMHGNIDVDVPMSHTEANYNACASDKCLLIVDGAQHTLCHLVGKENVEKTINDFICKNKSK